MPDALVVKVLPDGPEHRFDGSRPVSIGRDPAADVAVNAPRASRRHVLLTIEPGVGWVAEDQSSNGTFQDQRRIGRLVLSGPTVLRLGDPAEGPQVHVIPLVPAPPAAPADASGQQPGNPHPAPAPSAHAGPPTVVPGASPPPPPRRGPEVRGPGQPGPGQPGPRPGGWGPQPPPPGRGAFAPGGAPPVGPPPSQRPPGRGPVPLLPPPGPPRGGPIPPAPPGPAGPGPGVPPPRRPGRPQDLPTMAAVPGGGPGPVRQGPPPPPPPDIHLGQFTGVYSSPGSRMRLGRADDNDIVVPDLLASRHHAELRASGGGFEIVDLSSHNGTYVDGRRVRRSRLAEGSIVSIGHHNFRLHEGRLVEYVDAGNSSFAAMGLTVLAGGRRLLEDVSFALGAGQFLAVLGPTGAGKSTLVKALTGYRPADGGAVLYNGRDLYANYADLRNRIGYVPQDDILHPQLTVRSALAHAARLRFPPDVAAAARMRRVEEVMAELGLSHRAGLQVARLSGGQRKRVSVAIELLTMPSLLVLDEPTSGLDPGYEKSVMDLLRSLADTGRTVITVTHSIQSLHRCDRLLFLAPGGQTAYYGPPREALPHFHKEEYAEVFQHLDQAPPGQARAAFAGTATEHTYVTEPLAPLRVPGHTAPPLPRAKPSASWAHQLTTLMRRQLAIIAADRRNTAMLILQAPILGVLMLAVFGARGLDLTNPTASGKATTVLIALVLGATYLGGSNSVREIVKERPILIRERAVGLSASAYVMSKAAVLGVLTVLQAAILVFFGILRQSGPAHGAVLSSGRLELFLVVALSGLAAMTLGLAISSVVSNGDKALTILPVVLFAQFLLSGALVDVNTPGLNVLAMLAAAHWGFAAAAATADLPAINHCDRFPGGITCGGAFHHSAGAWIGDMAALAVLTGLGLLAAWWAIRPAGQPKRK